MIKNTTTVGELKKGQRFKHGNGGVYECANAYWPQARNPAYRAAKIVVITPSIPDQENTWPIVPGQCVTFNHRTKVELLSA